MTEIRHQPTAVPVLEPVDIERAVDRYLHEHELPHHDDALLDLVLRQVEDADTGD